MVTVHIVIGSLMATHNNKNISFILEHFEPLKEETQ